MCRYTSSVLSHTDDLQEEVQYALNDWDWQVACRSTTTRQQEQQLRLEQQQASGSGISYHRHPPGALSADMHGAHTTRHEVHHQATALQQSTTTATHDSSITTPDCRAHTATADGPPVLPDLLGNTSSLSYAPQRSFGQDGICMGGYRYWSTKKPGTRLHTHHRQLLQNGHNDKHASTSTYSSQCLLDEAVRALDKVGYEVYSLAVSEDEQYLAVTERWQRCKRNTNKNCEQQANTGSDGLYVLTVLNINAGGAECITVNRVDGPILWVRGVNLVSADKPSASHNKGTKPTQRLVYLSEHQQALYCLMLPSMLNVHSSNDASHTSIPVKVYEDPHHVRLSLTCSSDVIMVASYAPDGAPLEIRYLLPGDDAAQPWRQVLPTTTSARYTACVWGNHMFVR